VRDTFETLSSAGGVDKKLSDVGLGGNAFLEEWTDSEQLAPNSAMDAAMDLGDHTRGAAGGGNKGGGGGAGGGNKGGEGRAEGGGRREAVGDDMRAAMVQGAAHAEPVGDNKIKSES
jgi:hypothetical protein